MGRKRKAGTRYLGPWFVESLAKWRVRLARDRRRAIVRSFDDERSARAAMLLDPDSFIAGDTSGKAERRVGERVYFIQAGTDGPIKIGKAFDVIRRLNGLQAANWMELRLLAATNDVREREVHRKFSELRIRGEWFKPSADLMHFIESFNSTFKTTDTAGNDRLSTGGSFVIRTRNLTRMKPLSRR